MVLDLPCLLYTSIVADVFRNSKLRKILYGATFQREFYGWLRQSLDDLPRFHRGEQPHAIDLQGSQGTDVVLFYGRCV